VKDFVIEEHVEGDLVFFLVFIKIDVPGVINTTHHVLDASRHFENAIGAGSRFGPLVKGNIVVFFITTFIYIADKFIREQVGGVEIAFVFIPYFEKFIEKRIGFSLPGTVINRFAIKLFEVGGKNGFACSHIHAQCAVINNHGYFLAILESGIPDSAEFLIIHRAGE
jgi:hypothetical protein